MMFMMRLLKPLTTTLWAAVLLLSMCGCRQQSGHMLQAQNQPQVYYPTVNEGVIVPPFLSKGDTIGLVAPAYKDDLNEIKYAIQWLEKQGFHILNGQCIDLHHSTIYSGTDEERAADFQAMLDNPSVKAIVATRGGYGVVRMIDKVDWSHFREHPKWICGFSDITVIHSHVNRQCRVATIHSMMPLSIKAENSEQIGAQSLLKALKGQPLAYTVPSSAKNRAGKATGELIGGNLSLLISLTGSVSEMDYDGKILFIEDCDEYYYHVDRMLMELKRAGKLEKLAGLIVGGFVRLKEIDAPNIKFGKTVEEIVWDVCGEYSFPILFDFPAGHIKTNCALRLGTTCTMEVTGKGGYSTVKM
jgi:muramoyltetrapeptide carboxypeptidase